MIEMKAGRALNRLLYKASLKAARSAKDHYYRSKLEKVNRGRVDIIAGGWDEKNRAEEYRTAVLPYWKRFGRKPEKFWFELAGSRDWKMDPRFIPSDLYYMELLPYLNNMQFRFASEDKNYLDMRFPDVKQARTVCRMIAGEYYDDKLELITEEEAVRLCREREGELFIKPSLYSGFGQGIQKFDPAGCTDERIRELFLETGSNLIVQEKIRQHEVLASIDPDSVSTIRVLSLFVDGEVYIPNVYLRVSTAGTSHVTSGSEYNVEIMPDGSLCPLICLDEGGWFDNHKEGIFDDTLVIPGTDRVIETAKQLHPRVGHFKWIGWDFTLDQDGDPLLIEFNTAPGDHAQRVCGRPLFGDLTDRVLEDYFCGRSMEDYQLRGCWSTNENIDRYRE
jgi:hypothetical protein